jgi:hypothetical protein
VLGTIHRLQTSSIYNQESIVGHRVVGIVKYRKDWPQRSVVLMQSSFKFTGSFCHSKTRRAAICKRIQGFGEVFCGEEWCRARMVNVQGLF